MLSSREEDSTILLYDFYQRVSSQKSKIQVSIINKREQHGGSFLASNPIFDLFSSLNEKLSVTAILREKKKNKFRSRSEKKDDHQLEFTQSPKCELLFTCISVCKIKFLVTNANILVTTCSTVHL